MAGGRRGAWNASFEFRRASVILPADVGQDIEVMPGKPGADGSPRFIVGYPIIPIKLKNIGMSFETAGLLDTGADQSVLPWQVAEALDIRPQSLTGSAFESRGIGGKVRFKIAKLDLTLQSQQAGDWELPEFPFAVPLTDSGGPGYVLLGRHPLLTMLDLRFRLGFTDEPNFGKFTLTEVVKRRDASRYVKQPAMQRD